MDLIHSEPQETDMNKNRSIMLLGLRTRRPAVRFRLPSLYFQFGETPLFGPAFGIERIGRIPWSIFEFQISNPVPRKMADLTRNLLDAD